MNETALEKRQQSALQKFTNEELELIKQTVAKDATDEELSLFLYTAQARGLNPLTRQIHFVKRGGQGTIQTGIDGFRLIAERTGRYAPGTKPTIFEYDNKGRLLRATVFGIKFVGGQAFEYSATARFNEYAQYFNGRLGNMWAKMPETMLEKCAEAKLLRKGFPEELSGLYTHDEMAQADNIEFHSAELPMESPNQPPTQDDKASEATVDSDNPYASYLQVCPEHGDPWTINKFGRRCHKMPDGTWCNFSQQIRPALKVNAEKANLSDKEDFNDFVKKESGGKTWSKLTEEEQIEVLYALEKKAI